MSALRVEGSERDGASLAKVESRLDGVEEAREAEAVQVECIVGRGVVLDREALRALKDAVQQAGGDDIGRGWRVDWLDVHAEDLGVGTEEALNVETLVDADRVDKWDGRDEVGLVEAWKKGEKISTKDIQDIGKERSLYSLASSGVMAQVWRL